MMTRKDYIATAEILKYASNKTHPAVFSKMVNDFAEMFANWVNEISNEIGKPLPVTLALFGGYRKNNYTAVLDLHIKSILKISTIVCGTSFEDNQEIPEKYPRK